MMRHGNRKINVNKDNLIVKIKENKAKHIEEYEKAVVAYKEEALKQLAKQTKRVEEGALNAQLDLITPVNNEENYDAILAMFRWEENDVVELDQNEFKEYVLDETDFAITAKMSNTAYFVQ